MRGVAARRGRRVASLPMVRPQGKSGRPGRGRLGKLAASHRAVRTPAAHSNHRELSWAAPELANEMIIVTPDNFGLEKPRARHSGLIGDVTQSERPVLRESPPVLQAGGRMRRATREMFH